MRLFNITWSTDTAGPSPERNDRTEVFLFGCKKALEGNPCESCFNNSTWDDRISRTDYNPIDVAKQISKYAPNKYVTIGGGEPTDQIDDLIVLCKELKKEGFHILVYTWRSLKEMLKGNNQSVLPKIIDEDNYSIKDDTKELLSTIDILVDGEFILDERLYKNDKGDGLLNSIGSGNQIIWDSKEMNDNNSDTVLGYKLSLLDAIHLKDNTDDLLYIVKNNDIKADLALI